MTDIKHLMLKLNQISSQYLGKIMYALQKQDLCIKKDCLETRQSYDSGAKGLEPSISGVTGQRDNQLRYAPKRLV